MDTATRVQILEETVCILQSTDTLRKVMYPPILPPAKGKKQSRLGYLAFVRQPVKETENSESKPVKLRLKKLTLCHILPERRVW